MLSHNEAVMPDVFYRRKVKMKRTFYLVLQMGMANNDTLLTITLDFKSYSLFGLNQFDFAKMLVFFQVGYDEIMYSTEKEIQISGFLPLDCFVNCGMDFLLISKNRTQAIEAVN